MYNSIIVNSFQEHKEVLERLILESKNIKKNEKSIQVECVKLDDYFKKISDKITCFMSCVFL